MSKSAPHVLDLASRDVVSRAIVTEVAEGREFPGPYGSYVHLELMHLGKEKIESRLQEIVDFCRHFAGVDPVTEPIPVYPGQHYMMGGISTNIRGETNLRGLFAGRRGGVRLHPRGEPPRGKLAPRDAGVREGSRDRCRRLRGDRAATRDARGRPRRRGRAAPRLVEPHGRRGSRRPAERDATGDGQVHRDLSERGRPARGAETNSSDQVPVPQRTEWWINRRCTMST